MQPITLALAKGRTATSTIKLLKKAGYCFEDFHEKSRKLVFYDTNQLVQLIFVKAVDVPTYVEKGAADVGIVGKDNILETAADIYEMLDLKEGKCKFVIAGKEPTILQKKRLVVASKYPSITTHYFEKKGIQAETIKLNGSVELAPLIGMADVIVDIVETGRTLKENGLFVLEELEDISTRLITNKASFATKTSKIENFIRNLQLALEE
ncbi:ATP phosphoribosyltransferase [Ornithinibacillus californiensis]|uniref:ATP phosphoribosyltransferase n=1 Tax=Ornithinibacillus californiensis TaxID=161536 RepID=UPI00064DF2D1|nr:ATP phosphoribosyltransferase [Ornithinibacillus californiensis]